MTVREDPRASSDPERSRSEARLRSILENSNDWIWEMGLDGRHTYSNRHLEAILGYSTDEFAELDFFELLHPEDRAEVERRLPGLVAEGRGWSGWVVRARRKDGSWCYLESNASPLFDERGRVFGFQGVDRDITERRAAEERLRQVQKMEAVGQLAGGVAHDFNNLLTVILGESEILRRELEVRRAPREQIERAEAIELASARGASLTRQLLAFSRRGGKDRGPTDFTATLEQLESMLRRLIGEHIALEVEHARQPLFVPVGSSPLEQLVVNLVINARDAVREGGTIRLKAERIAGEAEIVRFTVQDDGRGMDEATRARVFEPFFTTKPPGEGTGLGLATVYGTVVEAGGTVTVESRPGRGSTFRVELPLVEPTSRGEASATPESTRDHRAARILVCEDDPQVRKVTRTILEQAGFLVEAAGSAREAVELVEGRASFDLLLTDVVMPDQNGIDLARALSARDPDLRVLFVSGHARDVLRDQTLREEDVAMLHKPFRPEDLLKRVVEILA